MSVYVSDFGDGSAWTVIHDEGGHTGTIDPATVQHSTNLDGSEDHNFLVIECPSCGSTSTHPVGGGAQPESVQQMFVAHCQSTGCPCGQVTAEDADALGESHIRLLVNRMDGPGRWQLA